MTNHELRLCPVCNVYEVGSLSGGTEYCSATCEGVARVEEMAHRARRAAATVAMIFGHSRPT
jgi:hypothetical protein